MNFSASIGLLDFTFQKLKNAVKKSAHGKGFTSVKPVRLTILMVFVKNFKRGGSIIVRVCVCVGCSKDWVSLKKVGEERYYQMYNCCIHHQVATLWVVISARHPGNPQTWQHYFT